MARMISSFALLWVAVWLCYTVFRQATNRQRWSAVKTGAVALLTAGVASAILTSLVYIF